MLSPACPLHRGPGCSSIGGGFLSELGPYMPVAGGNLKVGYCPLPLSLFEAVAVIFLSEPASGTCLKIKGDGVKPFVEDVRLSETVKVLLIIQEEWAALQTPEENERERRG